MSKLLSELAKGQWSSATAYTVGDIVDYKSSSYICIANSTNNEPPNATYWALLSQGIEWKGSWSAGTYYKGQAVENDGSAWIVTATSTTEEPTGTPTDWDLLTSKGDTGATGAAGADGADGTDGTDGVSSYTYIAYASDDSGTDFTLTFNSSLDYIAILTTDTEIPSPSASDFTGLWKNYKGETGDTGATGAQGDPGDDGVSSGLNYLFSTNTAESDPGAGYLKYNNASPASTTFIYIDNLENGGGDVSAYIDMWDNSTNSDSRGYLVLRKVSAKENFVVFKITGTVTDSTGYRKVTVTYVSHNGSFSADDVLSVDYTRTGDKGLDGEGSGDVVGPASATDGAIALFDTTTGKLLKNSTYVPTTLGGNLINATNPSAVTFLRINADNSVSTLSASEMRTALGLVIGTNVQAWDSDLDNWAGKTAPTGAAVGTTDTQTLTNKTINTASNTITVVAADVSDFDTEVANNSAVAANTAKVTNATHTGEVTGSTDLTIADNVVDEANLKVSNAPTDDYVLTADSAVTGGMKWAEASGGIPADGWQDANETWTYSSVDDPTGVITVPSDATTKYSIGMRIKFTNGGNTIYGIITAVTSTTITFLHEIDPTDSQALHLMANSAITANYYSTMKAPFGFPLCDSSWAVEFTSDSDVTESSPTDNVWQQFSSHQLTVPIGAWNLSWNGTVILQSTASQTYIYTRIGLSGSTSDTTTPRLMGRMGVNGASGALGVSNTLQKEDCIDISSKTTYYFVYRPDASGTGQIDYVTVSGATGTFIIRAVCAYL